MKRFKILLFVLILLYIPNVFADEPLKKIDINDPDDFSDFLVDTSDKIYDYSYIFTDEEKENIHKKIEDFSNKIDMDVVVITIDLQCSFSSCNEKFSDKFYNYNNFGSNYYDHSGVLLIINTCEKNQSVNAFSYGNAKLYFDSSRTESMISKTKTDFLNENYEEVVNTFINTFSNYYDAGVSSDNNSIKTSKKDFHFPLLLVFLDAIISSYILSLIVGKYKLVTKKINVNEFYNTKLVSYTKTKNILIEEKDNYLD